HYVVFFFSSRRRHTRSYGDWSSDVCSSDLNLPDAFSRDVSGAVSVKEALPSGIHRNGSASMVAAPIFRVASSRKYCRPSENSWRSEEHTSELQSPYDLVCRLLLEKKKLRGVGGAPNVSAGSPAFAGDGGGGKHTFASPRREAPGLRPPRACSAFGCAASGACAQSH